MHFRVFIGKYASCLLIVANIMISLFMISIYEKIGLSAIILVLVHLLLFLLFLNLPSPFSYIGLSFAWISLLVFSIGISGYQAYFQVPFNLMALLYIREGGIYGWVWGGGGTVLNIIFIQIFGQKIYGSIFLSLACLGTFLFLSKKTRVVIRKRYIIAVFIVLAICLFFYLFHRQKGSRIIIQQSQRKSQSNVLVIMVESLWTPITNLKINNKYVMPYYNNLKRTGLCFPYVSTVSGNTISKEQDFFSLGYQRDGIFIPAIFGANNYQTIYAHNGNQEFFSRHKFKNYGFSTLYFSDDMNPSTEAFFTIGVDKLRVNRDKERMATERDMFSFLKENSMLEQPFYLQVLTITGHFPYVYNPDISKYYSYFQADLASDDIYREHTIQSMAYIDDLLSEFIPYIQKKYPDTHILITGDTGFLYPKVSPPYQATEALLIPSPKSPYADMNTILDILVSHQELGELLLFISDLPYVKRTSIDRLSELISKGEFIPTQDIVNIYQDRISLEDRYLLIEKIEAYKKGVVDEISTYITKKYH